jgi:hypothetical protein
VMSTSARCQLRQGLRNFPVTSVIARFRKRGKRSGTSGRRPLTKRVAAGDVNKDGYNIRSSNFGRTDGPGLFALSDGHEKFKTVPAPIWISGDSRCSVPWTTTTDGPARLRGPYRDRVCEFGVNVRQRLEIDVSEPAIAPSALSSGLSTQHRVPLGFNDVR